MSSADFIVISDPVLEGGVENDARRKAAIIWFERVKARLPMGPSVVIVSKLYDRDQTEHCTLPPPERPQLRVSNVVR